MELRPQLGVSSIAPSFSAECRSAIVRQLPVLGWRTRFAPAPTGYLHLGHLVNALYVWGIARAHGGSVVLRIEDHDRTRCRPEYVAALIEDLAWLGFVPDLPSGVLTDRARRAGELCQSERPDRYHAAMDRLSANGLVYACACTRRDIERVVPHHAGTEPRYPGTCRSALVDTAHHLARRVRLEDRLESFDDLRLGRLEQRPANQCGDVLVRDRRGDWTYQFCVTVDDWHDEIDLIIRGEDLLESTGRQRHLARLLGRSAMPLVLHHPLLTHADGAKLSKAAGDTSLRERRTAGATASELIGEAAWRVGLQPSATPRSAEEIVAFFA